MVTYNIFVCPCSGGGICDYLAERSGYLRGAGLARVYLRAGSTFHSVEHLQNLTTK